MVSGIRGKALAVVLGMTLAACSSGSSDLFAEPADGGSGTTAGATGEGSTAEPAGDVEGDRSVDDVDLSGSDLSAAEASGLLDAYGHYLEVADGARLADEGARAELEQLAGAAVVTEVDAWADGNADLASGDLSTVELSSWPDVTAITGSGDTMVIHDCTAIDLTSDLLSLDRADYVEQQTTMRRAGDGWTVESVEVVNDGTPASGPLGCVPRPIQEELERVLTAALDGVAAAWADPGGGVDHVEGLLAPGLLEDLRAEIETMVAEGIYGDSPLDERIEVLGSDTVSGSRNYVVASCTLFPEGNPSKSIETGEVREDIPLTVEPGGRIHREWRLRTQLADDLETRETVVVELRTQEVDSDCGIED